MEVQQSARSSGTEQLEDQTRDGGHRLSSARSLARPEDPRALAQDSKRPQVLGKRKKKKLSRRKSSCPVMHALRKMHHLCVFSLPHCPKAQCESNHKKAMVENRHSIFQNNQNYLWYYLERQKKKKKRTTVLDNKLESHENHTQKDLQLHLGLFFKKIMQMIRIMGRFGYEVHCYKRVLCSCYIFWAW